MAKLRTWRIVARSDIVFPHFGNARAIYVRSHVSRITSTHYVNVSLGTHYISLATQNTHKTGKIINKKYEYAFPQTSTAPQSQI